MVNSAQGCPGLRAPLSDVETDRMLLRGFQRSDLPALSEMFAKPEVWQFPYGGGLTEAETYRFLEAQIAEREACGVGCWLAIDKQTGRPVGYVGLSVPHFLPDVLPALEVGWRFDPAVWGQGLATEGAAAALNQAFGPLGLERVCSAPQTINPPSGRVCQRLGMVLDRTVAVAATERRGAVDVDLYWITAEQWRSTGSIP